MHGFTTGDLIYENALASPADVADWRIEGSAAVSFPQGRMRMENTLDPGLGQAANFVHWCPVAFPDDIVISWDFWPLREPGLCVFFFAATGRAGRDLFDPSVPARNGEYAQYHHGDMDALHLSYFRHWAVEERAFHTCNLRKSYGFHMVAQGADPLPSVPEAQPPYHIDLWKSGPGVAFAINDLPILRWHDDGTVGGPVRGGGRIGFRQMAPLIAEYANIEVHTIAS